LTSTKTDVRCRFPPSVAHKGAWLEFGSKSSALLFQLAKSKGETYKPAADFPSPQFVFSSAEFELSLWKSLRKSLPKWLNRKQRLNEGRALPKTRRNSNPAQKMPAAA
jgi:hypothetical protein